MTDKIRSNRNLPPAGYSGIPVPSGAAMSRRGFLSAAAGVSAVPFLSAAGSEPSIPRRFPTGKPPLVCFTKHLQFSRDFNELAGFLVDLGFDGADLTVRPKGHVPPENVERDLPKATAAIRQAGLDVYMITTDIEDAHGKYTEPILKTASALGIPFYRIGGWMYRPDRGILEQIEEYKPKMKELAAMNAQYNIRAGYHNHSGPGYLGGPIWDIYEMLREVDPEWIGYNFDAAHAVAEGAAGAWETNFRLIADRIKMAAAKDTAWIHEPGKGWRHEYPPVGEGMTDWPKVLRLFKEAGFTGPISMHFEYEIPADSEEDRRKKELAAIQRDRERFAQMMRDAGLR